MAKEQKNKGMDELKKQVKQEELKGVYLLYGKEVYIKDFYIKKMIGLVDDGGMEDFNKIILEGDSVSYSEIDDAIESFPVMSEQKLVLIKDSNIFKKSNEEQKEYWLKRLENIPEYVVLIFNEKEIDKRNAIYKKVSEKALAVEFEIMNHDDTVTWVLRQALNNNKKMQKDVAQYFVSVCDEGLSNIKNELDKLINFCDEKIGKSDVDRVCSKSLNVKVFELTDCIMAKNIDGAMNILRDLKTIKEPAYKLLYILSSTFDKMLRAMLMSAQGSSYQQIGEKIKVPPFVAQKYVTSARGFGENFLVERIIKTANVDLAIKNGDIGDWDALLEYVTDSCQKI